MVAKHRFDEQCLELARYFYPDDSDEMLHPLAQLFQDTVEGFKPRGIVRADGTRLHAAHCTYFDIQKKCTCDPRSEMETRVQQEALCHRHGQIVETGCPDCEATIAATLNRGQAL